MKLRVLKVISLLREGGQNASVLAKALGISSRTVHRDIAFLRGHGYLIAYDELSHTFTLKEPQRPPFGGVALLEQEHYALRFAAAFLKSYGGAFLRVSQILEALSARAGGGGKDVLEGFFSAQPGEVLEESTLRGLLAAVVSGRTVVFHYSSLSGASGHREVEPYHVFFREGGWYLFGRDVAKAALRFYRLSRMRDLMLGDHDFEFPQGVSLQAVFEESFSLYQGGKGRRVVLEFLDPLWCRYATGIRWHSTQRVLKAECPAQLEFTVPLTSELERFVLGFGEHVRVLVPAEFSRRVRERHRRAFLLP
jgi:predicted DNA-binding transcriptional regulator YafY